MCATNGVDCTVGGDLLPPATLANSTFRTSTVASFPDVFWNSFALVTRAATNNKLVTFVRLRLQKRIDYKLCLFVRNCLVGTAPIYLRELCVPVSTDFYRQSLRSAARGDLMIPKFRIGHGKRGFAVAAPTLWNSLPLSVRRLYDQPAAFKRELKTFMFNLQSPAPLRISSLGALYKWQYTYIHTF